MNYAMSKSHAEMVATLLHSMTGEHVRLVSIIHGHSTRYLIERFTGTRWVRA